MRLLNYSLFLLAVLPPLVSMHATAQTLPASTSAVVKVAASGSASFGKAVSTDALQSYRGGELVLNDMKLSGVTADNTADHVITGTNAISSGSFANLSGIPVVIQNTGANVLIQNAVILNLQMK